MDNLIEWQSFLLPITSTNYKNLDFRHFHMVSVATGHTDEIDSRVTLWELHSLSFYYETLESSRKYIVYCINGPYTLLEFSVAAVEGSSNIS